MSYALSFAPEFFWGDDDRDGLKPSGRQSSVAQSLLSLSPETWALMARDLFGVPPQDLDLHTVVQRVIETNTCRNLDSPVEVFIDKEGYYSVLVY